MPENAAIIIDGLRTVFTHIQLFFHPVNKFGNFHNIPHIFELIRYKVAFLIDYNKLFSVYTELAVRFWKCRES